MIEQGDLLLLPFPFSDQSGRKVRPVIVISNQQYNDHAEDVVVVGVTSNISKDRYTISLSNNNLREGKFIVPCCAKAENILKVDKELIIKKIGKVKAETLVRIIGIIVEIIKLD